LHPTGRFRIHVCLLLLLAAWVCSVAQDQEPAPAEPSGSGKLLGRVTLAEKPVAGARALAYHLMSGRVWRSEPTDAKGRFMLDDLPFGYYDLAIETAEGLFPGNLVVNLPPAGKTSLEIELREYDEEDLSSQRRVAFPGADTTPSGVAGVQDRGLENFWRSPRGIAVLAGGGGAVLLAILLSGDDDNEQPASPF
jgi:hypothetical protein